MVESGNVKEDDYSVSDQKKLGDRWVGEVVKSIIERRVEDSGRNDRSAFMLTGLSDQYLQSVVESLHHCADIAGRSVVVAVNRRFADFVVLPESVLTDESAVYWRHYDKADVVVFAPSDTERDGIGAGLRSLARIDSDIIMQQTDAWVDRANELTEQNRAYLSDALRGLRESGVCTDLSMWVNFILSLREEKNVNRSDSIDRNIQNAAYALQIPRHGIKGLPPASSNKSSAKLKRAFRKAFHQAKEEAGSYVMLVTPAQEPVDTDMVGNFLKSRRDELDSQSFQSDDDERKAIALLEDLLNDSESIRPGEWRASQELFCREVSWVNFGQKFFKARARSKSRKLGERTHEFLLGDYGDDLTKQDVDVLERMDAERNSLEDEEIANFFDRWRDKLSRPEAENKRLYADWSKQVFRDDKSDNELMPLLLKALQVLSNQVVGSQDVSQEWRLLVRAHQNKASVWQSIDASVHRLFRFEASVAKETLGDRIFWDINQCFTTDNDSDSSSADKRQVKLEVYLLSKSDLESVVIGKESGPLNSASKVQAVWKPGEPLKERSIQLSLPEDVEQLDRLVSKGQLQIPSAGIARRNLDDSGNETTPSLWNTASFLDAFSDSNGVTVNGVDPVRSDQDRINLIRQFIDEIRLQAGHNEKVDVVDEAFKDFCFEYSRAINDIATMPGRAFAGDVIESQSLKFSFLCDSVRELRGVSVNVDRLARQVANIGVLVSKDEDLVFIAAWHPLRLLERKRKAESMRLFIDQVLGSSFGSPHLDIAFAEVAKKLSSWSSPSVTVVSDCNYVSVQSLNGYTLMASAESDSTTSESQESFQNAAKQIVKTVSDYLAVHPNKERGIFLAIDRIREPEFPLAVLNELEKQPGSHNRVVDLDIVDDEPSSRKRIFKSLLQKVPAGTWPFDEGAFIANWRLSISPYQEVATDEHQKDILALHEAVSSCAIPRWLEESRTSVPSKTDGWGAPRPRTWISNDGSSVSGVYLTQPDAEPVLEAYYNLLYVVRKDASLPVGKKAVLVDQLDVNERQVRDIIDRAHSQAQWVVTIDRLVSRQLLVSRGIKVIRDVSLPLIDARVIVSSSVVDEMLRQRVVASLRELFFYENEFDYNKCCDRVLLDVEEVSGKKILSASTNPNAAKEILGLSVSKAIISSTYIGKQLSPIWLSLDDYRVWFHEGNKEIADYLAVFVGRDRDDVFQIEIQVVEAKYISSNSLGGEIKKSQRQTLDTFWRLSSVFVTNDDSLSFKSWCRRLGELLISREGLVKQLPREEDRSMFFDSLASGDVNFRLSGESIVCLRDGEGEGVLTVPSEESSHVRTHKVLAGGVRRILRSNEQPFALEETVWSERPRILRRETVGSERAESGGLLHPDSSDHGECFESGSNGDPGLAQGGSNDPVSSQGVIDSGRVESEASSGFSAHEKAGTEGADSDSSPIASSGSAELRENRLERKENEGDIGSSVDALKPLYPALVELAKREGSQEVSDEIKAWSLLMSKRLQKALGAFNMHAEFVKENPYRLTPNSLLVRFIGHPTLTPKGVEKRMDELLTTHGIEVIDIRKGVGTITLVVKRGKRATVPLAQTWLDATWPRSSYKNASFLLGVREDNGESLFLNISGEHGGYEEHAPHALIAGETKSGKGVLTQSLMLQIVAFNSPDEVELIVIDPKMGVDYNWIQDMPHLREGIVTQPGDAAVTFEALSKEMDSRYQLFSELGGVNTLEAYNKRVDPNRRLPRIYLIHDEIGSWMAQEKDYRETVLGSVSHLGMKARAAGIHLILITQRADKDAIPGRLKGNLGNRLCLKVQDGIGSKMIIDTTGAERLLGRGHLAATMTGEAPPPGEEFFTAQVPFAPNDDLAMLAAEAKRYWRAKSKL